MPCTPKCGKHIRLVAPIDWFVLSVPVFIFCACYVIFSLLTLPVVHKVIVPLLLIISSAIAYNAIFFDVYFNRDMLTNVLQTTPAESRRLMTLPFVAWIIGLGVVPAVLYAKVKIDYRKWYKEILYRFGCVLLAVLWDWGDCRAFLSRLCVVWA